ncbi:DUF4328 domain-containing protein [Kitasatospora sp. NPDC004289]
MGDSGQKVRTDVGRAGPAPHRPLAGRAVAASLLIGLLVLRELVVAVTAWRYYALVRDALAGTATEADALALDSSFLTTVSSELVYLLVPGFVAGLAFIVWLWRARANAEAISGREAHRRSRLWIVWSWSTVVVNLWYPYQLVSDVWRASSPGRSASDGPVKAWWAFFVLLGFLSPIQRGMAEEWTSEAEVLSSAQVSTLLALLSLAAGVLAIVLIRRITAWQDSALELTGSVR